MSNAKQIECDTLAWRETLITMVETLSGAFFFIDDTQTIVYANARAQAITGATLEELCGNPFWHSAPQLVSTALYQAVLRTRQTQEPTEMEYCSPVTQTWLHVQLAPTVGGVMLQFHEVSVPARHQELVPTSQPLSGAVLDGLHARVAVLTPEGIVLEINEAPLADVRLRREEVIGRPLAQTPWWSFSPASQEQLCAAIARASTGETVLFEALVRPRDGTFLHFEVVITPHVNVDHHIEYLVMAGIDITARKRAEREIHALIDAIPHLVWTGRPDGFVDYTNQRWRDYTGMTTEQVQGDGWLQSIHPDDRQRVLAVWQSAVQTGRPYEAEQRLRQGTTGDYRWFLVKAMPFTDAQGTILKYIGTCTDIHDKKQAEDELRVLIDAIPQFVWMLRPDGSSEYCNRRWRDYTTLTLQQSQGDGWLQAIHPDDYQHAMTVWHHALETGESYEIECRFKDGKTGDYRWFLSRAMPVRDETGQIVKWFGTSTDIEDQKRTEQQLKESRENWRVLAETVPQFVWTTRPDGRLDYCNQRYCEYTHATFEQLQSHGWRPFLHPEDAERALALRQHSLETGEPYEGEQRLRNGKTGEYRWFLGRAMPVRDETGQIVKWVGTGTDIEDQKRTEQQLKTSEENWRVLAETVPQLVWTTGPDNRLDYCNQRYCEYMHATFEQLQGHGWRQFLHPEDDQGVMALRYQTLATGELYESECRLRNGKTGEYRWFLARGMPVRDETGQIVKWFGTNTDIEEQKRIEEALRQSQARVRTLTDSKLIGIVSNEGEEEVIVEANEAFLQMTGYTQEDIDRRTLARARITPPEDAPLFERALQELAAHGQHPPFETELVCKDGSRLPILAGAVTFQDDPRQIVAFMLDNSARKELERRKDDFINMASHELRNPLTILKLQTSLLHRQLARQGLQDVAPALSNMEVQIKAITRLVEELLDVSKIQAGRLEYLQERVDLDALLREIADIMQQTHPSHTILVQGAVQASLLGDRDRLAQVFTNLLSNAIKYSPDAQTVEMDLSASEDAATVRVRDYGFGIPREQRDKIFERFYRAAGPQQRAIPGLGMGLYIVAEIVKRHGGTIVVDSEVGKGSIFMVTLPLTRDA